MKKGNKTTLKLSDLKVQSFVTALNNAEKNTLLGGEGLSDNPHCHTEAGRTARGACPIFITPGAPCSERFPC